jgi:hypothetical protein
MARRRKNEPWPCTAEEIKRERDERRLSWRQVATNLKLGNPSAARKAYAELTGTPHTASAVLVNRARAGTNTSLVLERVEWDDDTDQDEIIDLINGEWVEESGEGKNYKPAHWSGSTVTVERSFRGRDYTEEVEVSYVRSLTFGPEGDQPLQVTVFMRTNGAARTFFVADITSVR